MKNIGTSKAQNIGAHNFNTKNFTKLSSDFSKWKTSDQSNLVTSVSYSHS